MILYRNVSMGELIKVLIEGQTIEGRFGETDSNTCTFKRDYVCAYVDEFEWRDRRHRFRLVLDINPNSRPFMLGTGEYHMTEYSSKNNRWSGKSGHVFRVIREAYFYYYTYRDIAEVILYKKYNRLNNEFIAKVAAACQLDNITLKLE